MSFAAEIFVAEPEESGLLLMHADPFTVWPHARLEGINLIELVILYKLLCDVNEPEQLIADFTRLDAGVEVTDGTPEPLLLLMPAALQRSLASHAQAAIESLVTRWTAKDAAHQLSQTEAESALTKLSTLCRTAEQDEKSILILL